MVSVNERLVAFPNLLMRVCREPRDEIAQLFRTRRATDALGRLLPVHGRQTARSQVMFQTVR